jgi:hypothetical protein
MSRKFLTALVLPADPANPLEAATKQYVDLRTGVARGIVAVGTFSPPSAPLAISANSPTTVASLSFATVSARRYRLALYIRVANATSLAQINAQFLGGGVMGGGGLPNADTWATVNTVYGHIYHEMLFSGIGGAAVTYAVSLNPSVNAQVWLDAGSSFYLEDVGT